MDASNATRRVSHRKGQEQEAQEEYSRGGLDSKSARDLSMRIRRLGMGASCQASAAIALAYRTYTARS